MVYLGALATTQTRKCRCRFGHRKPAQQWTGTGILETPGERCQISFDPVSGRLIVIREVGIVEKTVHAERPRRLIVVRREDNRSRHGADDAGHTTDGERQREVPDVAKPSAENREDDASGAV